MNSWTIKDHSVSGELRSLGKRHPVSIVNLVLNNNKKSSRKVLIKLLNNVLMFADC